MQYTLLFIAALVCTTVFGQDNVLIERSYWKEKPSLQKVKADIAAGNDPAAFNEHTFDAVTWAILEDADDAIVWHLLELEGNGVNKRAHDGRTPIFWAAYRDNLPLMKALVKKGAKTDLIDSHGYSLVNFAATTGQQNQLLYDFCIEHGADFSKESNNDGANPIHLLIPFVKSGTLISYFEKHGVDFNATDKHGNNAFVYAAKTGNIPMMKYCMEQGLDVHANNDAAVIFASKGTRRASVSIDGFTFLKEQNLDLKTRDAKGRNALYYLASKTEDLDLLEMLLKEGLKSDLRDEKGMTPLHQAAAYNSGAVVDILAYHSGDITLTNNQGENPVHSAAQNQNVEAIKVLLKMGVDINAATNEKMSALHLVAMTSKNTETLEFLVEQGADKSLQTEFGETAYDLASENELLQKNNTNIEFLKP